MRKPLHYTLDRNHPLAARLVAAWLFDKAGGSHVIDLTGNNDGTIIGNSIVKKPLRTGMGAVFSGLNSTDRINLGSISSANPLSCSSTNKMTILSRIKYSTSNNSYPRIFDKSQAGSGDGGYSLSVIATTGQLLYNVDIPSAKSDPIITPGYNDIAVVRKADAVNFYLSGQQHSSAPFNNNTFPTTAVDASIGNWNHSAGREFNGGIEYLYIFDTDLSANEIASLTKRPYQLLKPVISQTNSYNAYAVLFDSNNNKSLSHDIATITTSAIDYNSNNNKSLSHDIATITNAQQQFAINKKATFSKLSIISTGLFFAAQQTSTIDLSALNIKWHDTNYTIILDE